MPVIMSTIFRYEIIPNSIFGGHRTHVNERIQICMKNGRSFRDITDDMSRNGRSFRDITDDMCVT